MARSVAMHLIRKIRDSGLAVVVIEHDMAFVRSLHAQTSVLHLGRLFAQGTFDEIAANEDVIAFVQGGFIGANAPVYAPNSAVDATLQRGDGTGGDCGPEGRGGNGLLSGGRRSTEVEIKP
mgnify:CR=1 FL=1